MQNDTGTLVDLQMKIKDEWSTLIRNKARVFVFGATNFPWELALDGGMRRRFARRFYVGLPDLEGTRQILQGLLKDIPHSINAQEQVAVAQRLHAKGCSGSDISRILDDVRRELMSRIFEATIFETVSLCGFLTLIPKLITSNQVKWGNSTRLMPSTNFTSSAITQRFAELNEEQQALVEHEYMTQAAIFEFLEDKNAMGFRSTVTADDLKKYAEFERRDRQ